MSTKLQQHCFLCKEQVVTPEMNSYPCCSAEHKELWKYASISRGGNVELSWSGTKRAEEMGIPKELLDKIRNRDDDL